MNEDNPEVQERVAHYAHDALNRVTKWRTVFAGWQLGTRPKGEPECDALRDHRELTILLRVEVSSLAGLLIKKGVFSAVEWTQQLAIEAEALSSSYEKSWPGFTATLDGMHMKLPEAVETMKRRNFKP